MRVYFKIGFFILICSQLKAQSIPSNPAVKVSFNAEVTSYRQVPENTDLNLLTDFEKLTFKTRKEKRHYDEYLSQQNEPVTVITYGNREGYDGTTPDPVVKLVIDKTGSYGYDSNNQITDSQANSPKAVASRSDLIANISRSTFLKAPEFSDFNSNVLRGLESNGYIVSASSDVINFKNGSEEFSYNIRQNSTEHKVIKDGKVLAVFQNYYKRDYRNQLIPSLKIEKTYEVSQNGILIENVRFQQISNYTRIEN